MEPPHVDEPRCERAAYAERIPAHVDCVGDVAVDANTELRETVSQKPMRGHDQVRKRKDRTVKTRPLLDKIGEPATPHRRDHAFSPQPAIDDGESLVNEGEFPVDVDQDDLGLACAQKTPDG